MTGPILILVALAGTPSPSPTSTPAPRPRVYVSARPTVKPHIYRRPGRYELKLVVTAGDRTYQASVRVVVEGHGLVADGGSR